MDERERGRKRIQSNVEILLRRSLHRYILGMKSIPHYIQIGSICSHWIQDEIQKGGKPPLGKNASADAKVVAEKLLWGAAQSSEDGIDRWLLEIYAFVVTRAAPFFGRHIHQHNQYRRLLEG